MPSSIFHHKSLYAPIMTWWHPTVSKGIPPCTTTLVPYFYGVFNEFNQPNHLSKMSRWSKMWSKIKQLNNHLKNMMQLETLPRLMVECITRYDASISNKALKLNGGPQTWFTGGWNHDLLIGRWTSRDIQWQEQIFDCLPRKLAFWSKWLSAWAKWSKMLWLVHDLVVPHYARIWIAQYSCL